MSNSTNLLVNYYSSCLSFGLTFSVLLPIICYKFFILIKLYARNGIFEWIISNFRSINLKKSHLMRWMMVMFPKIRHLTPNFSKTADKLSSTFLVFQNHSVLYIWTKRTMFSIKKLVKWPILWIIFQTWQNSEITWQ